MMSNTENEDALAQARRQFRAGDSAAAVKTLLAHAERIDCAVRLREWALAERRLDLLPALLQRLQGAAGDEVIVSAAIQQQLGGDPGAAAAQLSQLIQRAPHSATAQHHLGRALQNLGRSEQAVRALQQAVQLDPDYAEAWYSLAHVQRARGQLEAAVDAYRQALQLHPDFRAALLNLGITLCAAEQPEAALAPLSDLLQRDPEAVEALINRGLCRQIIGDTNAALADYQQTIALAPGHPLGHFYLGCLLNEQLQSEAAKKHLQTALQLAPDDPEIITELVGLLEQNNELTAADQLLQPGLKAHPGHPGLNLEAARLQRRQGRAEEAAQGLSSIEPAQLPPRLAQQYWFERGLTLDRKADVAGAMAAFEQGNALAARSPRRRGIDRQAFPRRLQQLEDWLQQGAPGAQALASDPSLNLSFRPAFLLGFPRSGTTLLDTMLDTHAEVVSIEEQATLEQVVSEMLDPLGGYPAALPQLLPSQIEQARAVYCQAVQRWLPPAYRGVVLDKLPLRLLRLPLIRRLFPQAPVLFAVRHPCDVVLSNVMQQYAANEAFVHFDSIVDAARMYDRIMRLGRQFLALPGPAHWVRYERLISAPVEELRAACAALNIEFNESMLDTDTRLAQRGRIQTNSYQQVAEPIYQRAAGRWQRYRPWLEPVLPLLQPHIDWLGYSSEPA